ncbi:MAG TPA: hypothetical protein PLI97_04470, partial [Fluviicola sp.]|nr:hypothetical protein [Fluviicola sp.]
YTIQLPLSNACSNFPVNIPVVAQTVPVVSINPLSAIGQNASVSPTATVQDCLEPSNSYSWTFSGGSPATSNSLIPGSINFPSAGTFPITFSATNNCGTTPQTINLTVNPIPLPLNPSVNSPICEGDTANFTSNFQTGVNYSWTGPNSFTANSQNFSLNGVTISQAGTYTLTASLAGCAAPSENVTLTVLPNPIVTVTPPTSICFGNSTTLTANGASTYTWTPSTGLSGTTGATVTATPSTTQTYVVTGSNGTCSDTAITTVTVNPLPIVNAGNDTTVCDQPIPFQVVGTPSGGT